MKKMNVIDFWDGMYRFTVPLMDLGYGDMRAHVQLMGQITAYVQQFHARLKACIQGGVVIISAGGQKQFFAAAEYLVAAKPDQLGYDVIALLPGISEEEYNSCLAGTDLVLDIMGISAQLSKMMCGFYTDPEHEGKLKLIVYVSEITEDDYRWHLMVSSARYFAHSVLGERIKAEYFSGITVQPGIYMGNEGVTEMLLYQLAGKFREE
jgi:hypothetical protein